MASSVNAALCALLATAFWTALGYAVARLILPRVLALGASPVIGWAIFSAVSLPILRLTGFSPPALVGIAAFGLVAAGASLLLYPSQSEDSPTPAIPTWSFAAAAALALVPAVAIVPKFSANSVYLADPIFDHAKIAIIDAMTRQGLPPVNPAFGELGSAARLAYYYLWHFSAAELAMPLRISGWEADIGLTWFTAFASLVLMMAAAVWLSQKSAAALAVIALAAGTSLREAFAFAFGTYSLEPFMAKPTGFAGWLFQSAWVPQHLMAASCVIVATLLMVHYAQRQSLALLATLVLVVVAGFESSTYVGGVTFGIAALAAAPVLFAGYAAARRNRIAAGLVAAAILVLVLAAPFMLDQFRALSTRGTGSPIVLHHFEVLGPLFPPTLRRALDWAAYWFVLLPVEFPAVYVPALIAFAMMLPGAMAGTEKKAIAAFAILAAVGLGVSWLLVSTLGDNNDLGLRAVLPAAMALIIVSAVGMTKPSPRRRLITAVTVAGLVLSLPDTARMVRLNIEGSPQTEGVVFAQSPELWSAVRRYAAPTMRVANDPLFLQGLTPWPVNISWALLANRSSCFAGREMALAFAPLPPVRREAINTQFVRVFAGRPVPGDVGDMAGKFGCDVVVVVPQDGAWSDDPFASSAEYRLVESRDGKWRIYLRTEVIVRP